MCEFYKKSMAYFSYHVMINSIAHSLGGFGLALLLQNYLRDNAFLPPLVGWVCVAISVVFHIMSIMGSDKK